MGLSVVANPRDAARHRCGWRPGLVFALRTFDIKGPVAMCAGRLSGWFRAHRTALLGLYRPSSLVMIGLAVRLAWARRD